MAEREVPTEEFLETVGRVMSGEVDVEEVYSSLTDYGKAFLEGYVNGYHDAVEHVEMARRDDGDPPGPGNADPFSGLDGMFSDEDLDGAEKL